MKLKFDDYSFIFSFLFENQKKGLLTVQEREKLKTEFIAQTAEILEIYRKNQKDPQNLLISCKSYINSKSLQKNLSHSQCITKFKNQRKEASSSISHLNKYELTEKEHFTRKQKKYSTQIPQLTGL